MNHQLKIGQNNYLFNILKKNITSTQQIFIKKQYPINEQFTRELLQQQYEYNDLKTPQQILLNQAKKDEEQRLLSLKYNDKNPDNYVRLKFVKKTQLQTDVQKNENPFVLKIQPRAQKKTIQGIRRKIPTSMKKLFAPMRMISGLHIYDAIQLMERSPRKASKYVLKCLLQVKDHAKNQDFDETRLWVSQAISGKQRRFKKIYYHAKGRSGEVKTDICQIRIVLEEKPVEDLYKLMLQGKTPPMLAYIMRNQLLNDDADFETLQKYNYILTAKGRQQRKLMFKRRVLTRYLEFKRQGVVVPIKLISEKLLNEESKLFAEQYLEFQKQQQDQVLSKRIAHFKKNEESTG